MYKTTFFGTKKRCSIEIKTFFIPYIGTSFFLSRLKPLPANAFIVNASERTNWGLFIGTTLTKGDTISLNAEAKFFNQNEYGVSVEFRY